MELQIYKYCIPELHVRNKKNWTQKTGPKVQKCTLIEHKLFIFFNFNFILYILYFNIYYKLPPHIIDHKYKSAP